SGQPADDLRHGYGQLHRRTLTDLSTGIPRRKMPQSAKGNTGSTTMTPIHINRILQSDFVRYVLVSAAAFALDLAVLSACLRLAGLGVPASASIGFFAGAVLAYVFSTRW